MSAHISDLHDKGLHSEKFFANDHACKDQGVVGLQGKVSGPELGSFVIRRVDHELICRLVIRCCSLEALHVRAMTQLSLCVTANNLPVVGRVEIFFLLRLGGELGDTHGEHDHVIGLWTGADKAREPVDIGALLV